MENTSLPVHLASIPDCDRQAGWMEADSECCGSDYSVAGTAARGSPKHSGTFRYIHSEKDKKDSNLPARGYGWVLHQIPKPTLNPGSPLQWSAETMHICNVIFLPTIQVRNQSHQFLVNTEALYTQSTCHPGKTSNMSKYQTNRHAIYSNSLHYEMLTVDNMCIVLNVTWALYEILHSIQLLSCLKSDKLLGYFCPC